MRTIFIFIIFLSLSLYGNELKIASYNVENLFDLKYDRTEYKEYIPNSKSNWTKKTYEIKLNNTAKVIKQLDAHVIALQEIESQQALNDLVEKLPKYKYHAFIKNKNAAIGLAVLSQYPIIKHEAIKFNTKVNRPIQKVKLQINNEELTLFNNHWASKRNTESHRVNFALALQEQLKKLDQTNDYILLGDFNSNYNEHESLRFEKRLNDTKGFTGLNHVLNTHVHNKIITKNNIVKQKVQSHYNLWYELPYKQRFSSRFKNQNTTPDNILLPASLFDEKGFSYINNSFTVFKTDYLYENENIKRWQIKQKIHLQKGFSDHLPIYAKFNLAAYKKVKAQNIKSIADLYKIEQLNNDVVLDNLRVIYKYKNHAIIKEKNGRAIFLYNCAKELKQDHTYTLVLHELKNHHGLQELTKISILKQSPSSKGKSHNYLNATGIDLDDKKWQNEIITHLTGYYKDGYLYYDRNKKIKLYSKNHLALPKNGKNITIMSGHLGYYKKQTQLFIYKKNDIKVNF